MRRIKKDKAASIDGISMEALSYGGKSIRKGIVELITKIWKVKSIPEEWRKNIVVPIYKKGDHNRMENYREILLLYKIYVDILRSRVEEEVEDKELLLESQAGSRKERNTMDNNFVINNVIQRGKEKEDKQIYVIFVDFL